MYVQYPSLGLTLPRQLTPPRWVRDAVRARVGAYLKGAKVTIPTPSGNETFDLGDPASLAALKRMITGARFERAAPEGAAGPFSVVGIPGGWATLALLAGGIYLLASRRRRARA